MAKAKVYASNGGAVRMRANPSTNSKILTTIEPNTEVELLEQMSEWSKIEYKGTTGYMMNKFLITESAASTITKSDLQKIYNSLKSTLDLMNDILK